jgi:hypothetical protein
MRGAFFEILDFGGFQNDRELIKALQGIPLGRVGHRSPGIPRLPQRGLTLVKHYIIYLHMSLFT